MKDLGFDVTQILDWFHHEQEVPYVLVRVSEARAFASVLGDVVRRCYVGDTELEDHVHRTGRPRAELVAARMPDPGSTMSGDFGEILAYLYHAAREHPQVLLGPKKWRLKQDRTKPAPHSDVVHFLVPDWPNSSARDRIFCSEVKTKATPSKSVPITDAVSDCEKDRISRLARTLVWLRERALTQDLESTSLELLARFIDTVDHPPADKKFHAIVVVCSALVDDELASAASIPLGHHTLVVIAVPDLKRTYESTFAAAHATVASSQPHP